MTTTQNIATVSIDAGSNFSALTSIGLAVKINSSGVVVVTGAGEQAAGVLANNPVAGQPAEVVISGIALVRAGGNITRGNYVSVAASGKAVESATSGHYLLGQALDAGVDGQLIRVLLTKTTRV